MDGDDYYEITLFGKTITGWRAQIVVFAFLGSLVLLGYSIGIHHI